MCQINEDLLLDLAQVTKLINWVACGIEKVGYEGLNKEDIIWLKKNKFKLEIQKIFLFQIKNEAYNIYCSSFKNESYKFEKLGLKYLSLLSLPNMISKISFIVFDSPNSELTKFLLDTELKNSVIFEKWSKSGHRIVTIRWRDYIERISNLIEFYRNVITNLKINSQSKEGDGNNENAIKY